MKNFSVSMYVFVHWFNKLQISIRPFIHPSIHGFIHLFVRSFGRSVLLWFIHRVSNWNGLWCLSNYWMTASFTVQYHFLYVKRSLFNFYAVSSVSFLSSLYYSNNLVENFPSSAHCVLSIRGCVHDVAIFSLFHFVSI